MLVKYYYHNTGVLMEGEGRRVLDGRRRVSCCIFTNSTESRIKCIGILTITKE